LTPTFFARQVLREFRGAASRLLWFALCLAIGVAAVVVVAGLSRSLDRGIRGEARSLLAADLAIRGRVAATEQILEAVDGIAGSRRTELRETVTIVAVPGRTTGPASLLVELKVVAGEYPFYGSLELEPTATLDSVLGDDGVAVARELLPRLDVALGDSLLIGGEPFTIRAAVLSEPDRIGGAFTLGPRVFMSGSGLDRTGLSSFGSRVEHRLLVALPEPGPPGALAAAKETIEQALPTDLGFRVETYQDAQPALRRGLRRLERYLGLVALLSLLVGGVGVGQAIRSWISSRLDAIAILKCLGLRPREAFTLYFGQALLLGLGGSLAGCALGVGVLALLPAFLGDLVPARFLQAWQPAAMLRGLLLGVGVTAIFGLLPLSRVLQVSPARVLRRDAEPLPGSRSLALSCGLLLVLGIGALAGAQASSPLLGLQFLGGLLATTIGLAGAAWLLTRAAQRFPRDTGRPWLRHGLASLARPGASTLAAIVAIGLGLLVVFATDQVQGQLRRQIAAELPQDAPSAFFIDVQPDQWAPLEQILTEQGATAVQSVPVVMARLRAIDGVGVGELAESSERGGRRWALTREQRLTYMATLPEGNRLLEGELWADEAPNEISLEREFAEDLGVGVGAALDFDLQGVPISFVVTSLREVEWESFGINFFLVAEPGLLEEAPQSRLATARLPEGVEQETQDLIVRALPNITVVLVGEVLDKIVALMNRLGLGIRLLGGFTLIAGFAILTTTVGVESSRRGREVALLKTLGMKRNGVAALFATEYALLGLVAGLIGALGGGLVSWLALTRGMELTWRLDAVAYLQAVFAAIVLTVVAGVAASIGALQRRPIEVLREE
jgi:putative ABC transport system permease protein